MEERGACDLAHRVLQVCGQVIRYGIATGGCTRNLAADLRAAYNRAEYLPERKKMMQAWAKHIEALRQGAKVIPFKAA